MHIPPVRLRVLLAIAALAGAGALFISPIPQDPAYHRFADGRALLGVPNALNVLSNAPFAIIGALGVLALLRGNGARWAGMLPACYTLFIAVFLVAFGSAIYHCAPDNGTLLWDRLPMAVAFMSLLAVLVADRVSWRAGELLFAPLVCAGIGSVAYWGLYDDLRFYMAVQFGSMLVVSSIVLLFPPNRIQNRQMVRIIGWYAGAKVLESLDSWVYGWGGVVSGHSLKHLAAAMATLWMFRAITVSPEGACFNLLKQRELHPQKNFVRTSPIRKDF